MYRFTIEQRVSSIGSILGNINIATSQKERCILYCGVPKVLNFRVGHATRHAWQFGSKPSPPQSTTAHLLSWDKLPFQPKQKLAMWGREGLYLCSIILWITEKLGNEGEKLIFGYVSVTPFWLIFAISFRVNLAS